MIGNSNITRIARMFLAIVLVSAIALPTQVASAAAITVTTTSDGTGGPDCTLRDAITAADKDIATGGCPAGSGADTIVLASGATYTLTKDTLVIHSQINIEGNGSIIERSDEAGIPEFRIFYLSPDGDLTLNELTVRNGKTVAGGGGGIKNWGTLTMNHSSIGLNSGGGIATFEDSSVDINYSTIFGNSGGGISNNRGSVVIDNSTVRDNYDTDRGGGISNYLGTVAIYNSTISGNRATLEGGGIRNRGSLYLINSTVVNNTSDEFGGGIWNYIEMTISSSTIGYNKADKGSGIYNHGSGTVHLANTIVDSQIPDQNCAGVPVNSLGYNLDSDGTCNLTATGDISGVNPLLGPLQDNGGPTWTHALLGGSPAIDAVPLTHCTLTTDQRHLSRPQGPACDIGSFEVGYVHIDIKPGSSPNSINLESKGVVPVAVLTTDYFDASTVDPATVLFAGASPLRWVLEDVDLDGDMDLVFHFKTLVLNLNEYSDEAILQGKTFDDIPVLGQDAVRIVP